MTARLCSVSDNGTAAAAGPMGAAETPGGLAAAAAFLGNRMRAALDLVADRLGYQRKPVDCWAVEYAGVHEKKRWWRLA